MRLKLNYLFVTAMHAFLASMSGGTLIVNPSSELASDANTGSLEAPLVTINQAAQLAQPGDTIVVYPGVYRERVIPARGGEAENPITYKAKKAGTVVVKGSDIWRPEWKSTTEEGVYTAELDLALFENWRIGRDEKLLDTVSPFHEEIMPSNSQDKLKKADRLKGPPLTVIARPSNTNNDSLPPVIGQIFANSIPLQQALSMDELRTLPGAYFVGELGEQVYVNLPQSITQPQDASWEITTREQIFAPILRRLGYLIIDGIHFEHAANQAPWPSVGAVSVRNGHHWTIRNCAIRMTQSVGLDIGGEYFDDRMYGDDPDSYGHIVENCQIQDNGLTGIYGYEVSDTILRYNEISGNNRLGFIQGFNARWEEYAGIKLLHALGVQVVDNYVHDNFAFGIWFDNQWQGSRISRNLVVDNQFGGVFIEFGEAPDAPLMIDNNIVMFTDEGSGIYCHDSSDIIIAHNFLYQNKDFGLWMWAVSPRGGSKGGTRNNYAIGNVMYGNGSGNIGYPAEGDLNTNNRSNYNLFDNKNWARAADEPTFSIHESYSNPGVSRNDVANLITEKMQDTTGIYSKLSYDFWRSMPSRSITFAQWKVITGNDRQSLRKSLKKALYRPRLAQLELIIDENWASLAVPTTVGTEIDYYGRLRQQVAHTLPGPFAFNEDPLKQVFEFVTFGRDAERNLIQKNNQQVGRQRLNLWPKPQPIQSL